MNVKRNMLSLEEKLNRHVINSSAMITVANPCYALYEKFVLALPPEVAYDTRELGTILGLTVFGFLYDKGRNFSHWTASKLPSKLNNSSVDTLWTLIFGSGVTGAMISYGEGSPAQVTAGLLTGGAVGLAIGDWIGTSIDSFRQLIGRENPIEMRFPQTFVNEVNRTTKGSAAFVAAFYSLGATYAITKIQLGDYKGINPEKYLTPIIEKLF